MPQCMHIPDRKSPSTLQRHGIAGELRRMIGNDQPRITHLVKGLHARQHVAFPFVVHDLCVFVVGYFDTHIAKVTMIDPVA